MKQNGGINSVKKLCKEDLSESYDFFIGFFGRESRATSAYINLNIDAEYLLAMIYFSDDDEHEKNIQTLDDHNFRKFDDFSIFLRELFSEFKQDNNIKVLIDISCSKKTDLSKLLCYIANKDKTQNIQIDFVYSHAQFSQPKYGYEIGSHAEPIIDDLTGYDLDDDRPSSLILGLGYEPNIALSFIEHIDPQIVWTFSPFGHDQRYENSVKKSNESLLNYLPDDENLQLRYPYNNIYNTFERLESFVNGALQDYRITIAPYGMKIFFLCSLLVAIIRTPKIAIWHLRNEPDAYKIDRKSDGKFSFLRTIWAANEK